MGNIIFTVGHSNHSIEWFTALLKRHSIDVVCDVRSAPASRTNPQFNKEALRHSLKGAGIKYGFFGRELGARPVDKRSYKNGQVQYEILAKTDLFRNALKRIETGAENHRLALMCAEKDPLHCHRAILIARELTERGLSVEHILADGGLETHAESIDRLIVQLRIASDLVLQSRSEIIAEAYRIQGSAIAYEESPKPLRASG